MPQTDIKYSSDIALDLNEMFIEIENILNSLDSSCGANKCRAYPANDYLHPHVLIDVAVMKKPHRDEVFMQNCLKSIETVIKPFIPTGCYYAVHLHFTEGYYVTCKR